MVETNIILIKKPDIIYTVFHHGKTLGAKSERIAGIFFGVIADISEYIVSNHSAASKLNPAGIFTGPASFSAANKAA